MKERGEWEGKGEGQGQGQDHGRCMKQATCWILLGVDLDMGRRSRGEGAINSRQGTRKKEGSRPPAGEESGTEGGIGLGMASAFNG